MVGGSSICDSDLIVQGQQELSVSTKQMGPIYVFEIPCEMSNLAVRDQQVWQSGVIQYSEELLNSALWWVWQVYIHEKSSLVLTDLSDCKFIFSACLSISGVQDGMLWDCQLGVEATEESSVDMMPRANEEEMILVIYFT